MRTSVAGAFAGFLVAGLSAWALAPAAAQEPTSETDDRLKEALGRFPQADADGDGVLTAGEARAFRQRVQAQRRRIEDQASRGPAPTLENVRYGPHERNVMDLWLAKSPSPAPLVVFIHGGGFVGGDKSRVRGGRSLRTCLDAGVSFASINYRFREHAPIQDILRDAARAIQTIRSRAGEWNIDPERIAAYGSSAGAGTSLWLAVHDDLADPDSDDPVLRESSRLAAAGMLDGQASYDLRDWDAVVGPAPFQRTDLERLMFYGIQSEDELATPEADRIMKDCSMIGMISEGDPPIAVSCTRPDGEPMDRGHYVHHPKHARAVAQKCREHGVEYRLILRDENGGDGAKAESAVVEFLLEKLGVASK